MGVKTKTPPPPGQRAKTAIFVVVAIGLVGWYAAIISSRAGGLSGLSLRGLVADAEALAVEQANKVVKLCDDARSQEAIQKDLPSPCVLIENPPSTDESPNWSVLLAESTLHHTSAAIAVANGELWFINGAHGAATPKSISIFNPMTETWRFRTPEPPLKFGGTDAQAVFLDPYIYYIGGARKSTSIGATIRLDTTAVGAVWESIEEMPTPRSGQSCVAVGKLIYCAHGKLQTGPLIESNVMEVLDTETRRWSTDYPPSPLPGRHNMATTLYNGKIYYFGGFAERISGNGVLNSATVETFDPVARKWDQVSDMPYRLHGLKAIVYQDSILLVGGGFGKESGGPTKSIGLVWKYSPAMDTYTCLPPMPAPRSNAGVMINGRYLYALLGGDFAYRSSGMGFKLDLSAATPSICPEYNFAETIEFNKNPSPDSEEEDALFNNWRTAPQPYGDGKREMF